MDLVIASVAYLVIQRGSVVCVSDVVVICDLVSIIESSIWSSSYRSNQRDSEASDLVSSYRS